MARNLSELAEESGVELRPEVEAALAGYLELLRRWGRSINLTGDPSPETVVERQLPDPFHLASLLRPMRPIGRCLDVGAGAGLVAIPLALLVPELTLTLVEPNQRKCAFLRTVAHELPLPLEVRPVRLEAVQERFEVVMSRATWAPERWAEEARRVVAVGGMTVVFSREALKLPGLEWVAQKRYRIEGGAERCVSVGRDRPE